MTTTYDTTVRPTRDRESGTYHMYHDSDSSWKVTTDLVFAISSLTEDDPSEMLPLNRAVDPDVLESHVHGRKRGAHLSFDFRGYHVTVRDDGQIEFTPLGERDE